MFHLGKNIRSIQAKYGHKYDKYLHRGNLLIFNRTMTSGLLPDFAKQLVNLEKESHMKSYTLFKMQVSANKLLGKLLPPKFTRQVVMLKYLLLQKKDREYKIQSINSIVEKKN